LLDALHASREFVFAIAPLKLFIVQAVIHNKKSMRKMYKAKNDIELVCWG